MDERSQRKAQQYELMFADTGLSEQVETPLVRAGARHIFSSVCYSHPRRTTRCFARIPARAQRGYGHLLSRAASFAGCFAYLGYKEGDFRSPKESEKKTLALPVYPELTDDQQDYVVSAIAEFFRGWRLVQNPER